MAKSKPNTSHNGVHHEKNAKAVISLMVLLIAFSVFILFNTYWDELTNSSSYQMFMILTVGCFGLLVGLLYLLNKHHKN